MISNVTGYFKDFTVTAEMDGDDFSTAKIQLKAAVNSINTNNEMRDAHLCTSDFFEADKYPEMVFTSTNITKVDNETYHVNGDLTLRGVTKPVKLLVEHNASIKDPWGTERAGFVVSAKLNRMDWNVAFNSVLETGGLALSEEVRLQSEIQLVKQAEAVLA
jgi:polyisoprenoid-binding protein YceI